MDIQMKMKLLRTEAGLAQWEVAQTFLNTNQSIYSEWERKAINRWGDVMNHRKPRLAVPFLVVLPADTLRIYHAATTIGNGSKVRLDRPDGRG